MGLSFFRFLRPKTGTTSQEEIVCTELLEAAQEYQIRELCFWVCVNMIANALGRCEMRTFRGHEEIREREYYLWNVEPNTNQNSTAFWHKLVARLCQDNEALIIPSNIRGQGDGIVVADDWAPGDEYPSRQNEYRSVRVGDMVYEKTFHERDVMHLKLNHLDLKPVIDGLHRSYYRLISAAMRNYEWNGGQHWKVHVSQIAQGEEGWAERFQAMITAQVKPFLESGGAVLPEFDGYKYENVGGKDAGDTRDLKAMIEDVFDLTARSFLIPAVLVNGKVEATADANNRFLTYCLDPICDQITEEGVRKRYGYDQWSRGDFLRLDSSSIIHFDLFANAANVEKLVGSGAFTINDILRAANQVPINEPWADEHYLTKNIAALSESVSALSAQKGGNA